jgi:hypothetical protein
MATYVCPMHPEVQSDRATNCSKCGMKLELREEERSRTGSQPRKKEGERK